MDADLPFALEIKQNPAGSLIKNKREAIGKVWIKDIKEKADSTGANSKRCNKTQKYCRDTG